MSTDHSPWPEEVKNNPNIFKNASGAPGLETLIPALYTGVVDHGLSVTQVAKLTAEGPAKYFLLYPRKGVLAEGSDADMAILETGEFPFDAKTTVTCVDLEPLRRQDLQGPASPPPSCAASRSGTARRVLSSAGDGLFLRPVG